MPNNTLEKWEEKTIKQLSTLICDGDWIESKNQSQSGIRLIQTGNVGNGFYKDKPENSRYISEETFKKLNCTEIFSGDCLVSRLPEPLGRACLIPDKNERMITAVDCSIIRFNDKNIIPKYFIYYSISNNYHNKIMKLSTGATRQRISRKNLETITIPTPNLQEQQRIVGILDEAFENIEKTKQNTLTTLNNAKELSNTRLNILIENLSKDFGTFKLKDITTKLGDGLHGTPKFDANGNVYFINGNNLDNGNIVIKQDTKLTTDEEYVKYKKELNDRTVLVSINGTVGNVAFYNNEKIILGKSACYFNLKENISKEYIKQLIQSNYFLTYASKNASEMTIKNVSLEAMRNFPVPMPPLSEQKQVSKQINELQVQTKKLEQIYTQKLQDLDELKQSLLQKAFNGEL